MFPVSDSKSPAEKTAERFIDPNHPESTHKIVETLSDSIGDGRSDVSMSRARFDGLLRRAAELAILQIRTSEKMDRGRESKQKFAHWKARISPANWWREFLFVGLVVIVADHVAACVAYIAIGRTPFVDQARSHAMVAGGAAVIAFFMGQSTPRFKRGQSKNA